MREKSHAKKTEALEKVKDRPLLVNSLINRKMKPMFTMIAQKICDSLSQEKPIIIRYHNDADGISSMLLIEEAVRQKAIDLRLKPDFLSYRMPSVSPVYDARDALHDIAFANRILERAKKRPVILILDNGSTREDEFGIRLCRLCGYEVIVIDHHDPGKMEEDPRTLHCNPHLFGGSHGISTGMMAAETSQLIDVNQHPKLLPAVSAVADKCSGEEAEKYVLQSGKDKKTLLEYATALDYAGNCIRTESGTGIFELILEKTSLRKAIFNEVQSMNSKALYLAESQVKTEKWGEMNVAWANLENIQMRYPPLGKLTGLLFEKFRKDSFMMLGCTSSSVTIRSTEPLFPVRKLMEHLQKELPHSIISGGGHDVAGTIHFASAKLEDVLKILKGIMEKKQ